MRYSGKFIYTGAGVTPGDPTAWETYKLSLLKGQEVRGMFEEWEEHSEDQFNYFHKLRDRYTETTGYDKAVAKLELKYLFGVRYEVGPEFFKRPPSRLGMFAEMYGQYVFFVSTKVYSKEEMGRLIDGTIRAIVEAGGEVGDLVEE